MSKIIAVSIQEGDRELLKWMEEMKTAGTLPSPSLTFRDAMMQKKHEWEIIHSESPKILHERIDSLKFQIARFSRFLDQNKDSQNKFFSFMEKEDLKKPKKEIIEKEGKIIGGYKQ